MSYIVYGGPLFWPVIGSAAVLAALLGRFTYKHWHHGPMHPAEWAAGHGRHAATQTPGGESRRSPRGACAGKTGSRGAAPPPAAGSGVPGGGDGLLGDTGVLPAGYGHLPDDAERTAMFAQLAPQCPRCGGPHYEDECDQAVPGWPAGMPPPAPASSAPSPSQAGGSPGAGPAPWEPAPQPVTPAPPLEPLPETQYLSSPVAAHAVPDVQAAECGPDHEYDDLYRDEFERQPKGDADYLTPAERESILRALAAVDRGEVVDLGDFTRYADEPEPQTVTDMRAVPAPVAAREHAISRIRLKAHVSVTLARKPPLRQYVEDVIGISPAEDWEQLLAEARAGGSDE